MDIYKQILRPLLFKLDAESAHNLVKKLLRRPALSRLFAGSKLFIKDERLRVDLSGVEAPNPVGLGAGFDKDADMANSLMQFGFGYIVSGSIMYHVRPGNPRPRMIRDPQREALFSCMGLPSLGLDYAVGKLRRRRYCNVPLIVNINAENFEEYLTTFEAVQPYADIVEINLFCPNVPDESSGFLDPDGAGPLLGEIAKRKERPVFIKLPGYVTETERQRRLDLVWTIHKHGIEGIAFAPESLVKEKRLSIGQGTLTGRPFFPQILGIIRDDYSLVRNNMVIKASGGIVTGDEAFQAIAEGASSVELYTGLIYEGWNIARNINRRLIKLMDDHHVKNVKALRGSRISVE
ncbi:MAG: dihydroorotate dehydrogenase 2 [Deltaproteobacteria bacterium]|nr:MAG: dihydroorotate dehydrogenase 2 [Deltaproteobacteria bacterium]